MRWLGCAAAISVLMLVSYYEMHRVEDGNLFLFAMPGEAPPTLSEIEDAHQSARLFLVPSLLCAVVIGSTLAFGAAQLQSRFHMRRIPSWLIIAFILACVADFITTLHFFRTAGVEHELHPGIRLFGYAYGRTAGPALGKLVQIVGLLALAAVIGRWGSYLIALATVLFTAAAIYNFLVGFNGFA